MRNTNLTGVKKNKKLQTPVDKEVSGL